MSESQDRYNFDPELSTLDEVNNKARNRDAVIFWLIMSMGFCGGPVVCASSNELGPLAYGAGSLLFTLALIYLGNKIVTRNKSD